MKLMQVADGFIVNIAVFSDDIQPIPSGWAKHYSGAIGDRIDENGVVSKAESPAKAELTVMQKIIALEQKVTPRMIRGAAIGDLQSIDMIKSIESDISALRSSI